MSHQSLELKLFELLWQVLKGTTKKKTVFPKNSCDVVPQKSKSGALLVIIVVI